MSRRTLWAAWLLLGAACAGGTATPPSASPAPAAPPGAARPADAPRPLEPAAQANERVRYPRSGSGRQRYAFLRRDSIVVTMPSGEEQLQETASTSYLTLSWTAADSGVRFEAVVDSVVNDPDFPVPPVQLDSVRGSQWSFRQATTGAITGVVGRPASFRGEQLRDQLLLLYPILPEGGAAVYTSWRDSTAVPTRISAFPAEAVVQLEARAEPREGRGLRIVTTRQRSAEGQSTLATQAVTVRATGADSLVTELDPDARVLDATVHRVTDFVVELPAIGQTVPGREVSFLRMTLLR